MQYCGKISPDLFSRTCDWAKYNLVMAAFASAIADDGNEDDSSPIGSGSCLRGRTCKQRSRAILVVDGELVSLPFAAACYRTVDCVKISPVKIFT